MKKLLLLVSLFLFSGYQSVLSAEKIPLEDFFNYSQFNNMKISPDGKHLAFTYREGTQVKLGVMRVSDKKPLGKYEFGEWMQVADFDWANNERVLMTVRKFVGTFDENGSAPGLVAGNINGSKRKVLFGIGGGGDRRFGFRIVSMLDDEPRKIMVLKSFGFDRKEKGKVKPYKLDIYTGKDSYTADVPPINAQSVLATNEGSLRFGVEFDPSETQQDVVNYKISFKKPDSELWNTLTIPELEGKPGDRFFPVALSPDNQFAYITTNVKDKTSALYKIDLNNGDMSAVSSNPNVDLIGLLTAPDETVLAASFSDGYPVYDFIKSGHAFEKTYKDLLKAFPNSVVSVSNFTEDKKTMVISVRNDLNPGDFYLFDLENNKATYLSSRRDWVDPDMMSPMKPIKVTARDGLKMHGYLTLPKGTTGKNLPLIINPHGGPHGIRDDWGYNPEVQFLANRGYAVIQPNYRGSGGYGYDFLKAGYRKWGTAMQDDLTDFVKWAIAEGIADPERICIYGGSYGGYASLMSATREPDLYKCALGYVGVYDLKVWKKFGDTPKFKAGRRYLDNVHGTENAELEANSPSYNVSKIKAALFLAHGSEDVRVPMEQYYALTNALDKEGIKYESMVRKDGHGYTKLKNRFDFYRKAEKFFDKHIGSGPKAD